MGRLSKRTLQCRAARRSRDLKREQQGEIGEMMLNAFPLLAWALAGPAAPSGVTVVVYGHTY